MLNEKKSKKKLYFTLSMIWTKGLWLPVGHMEDRGEKKGVNWRVLYRLSYDS